MNDIKVFHGSYCEVRKPSLDYGRSDADFGLGFYVTTDLDMAEKWAGRKKRAIINEYILDMNKLTAYTFLLSEEWLSFVIDNRNGYNIEKMTKQYDLLIGATADDKLYATIEQYESGFISVDTAVEVLNCMKIGQQICIRTELGLEHLKFERSMQLSEERIKELHEINQKERKLANQLTSDIIRKSNRK